MVPGCQTETYVDGSRWIPSLAIQPGVPTCHPLFTHTRTQYLTHWPPFWHVLAHAVARALAHAGTDALTFANTHTPSNFNNYSHSLHQVPGKWQRNF